MATVTTQLPLRSSRETANRQNRRFGFALTTGFTALALIIHGYHPYAEDGGVYLAGVKRLLHPELYPHFTEFVSAPTRYSVFAPFLAELARVLGLTSQASFDALILVLHLGTIWTTLYGAYSLASRCWRNVHARVGAVLLLACWLSLPVAGTSLLFMDPYLTARSFSTPCLVAALIAAVDLTADRLELESPALLRRAAVRWVLSIVVCAALHPLMAVYALLASTLLASQRLRTRIQRIVSAGCISGASFATAALVHAGEGTATPDYTHVAFSRTYWFLSQWHWYELIGIAAPAAILAVYALLRSTDDTQLHRNEAAVSPAAALAASATICALLVTAIALLFARPRADYLLAAALQPMRGLQFVYLALILNLGATLGQKVLARRVVPWLAAVPLLGGPLLLAAHAGAPRSPHVEFPGMSPTNDWVRAFLWARGHTPSDALFALPEDYISNPGEDAQCFRAIAERSALPDQAKDGGEAAVSPNLASAWTSTLAAESGLASQSDSVRRARLQRYGVDWLVLPAASSTDLDCPYTNHTVKVCKLS